MTTSSERHPLAVLREELGLSMAGYARELDAVHRALGLGGLAHERQKIYRWEKGLASPESSAQQAIAVLHGIPVSLVVEKPWPEWLMGACGRANEADTFGRQKGTVEMLS